MAPEHLISNLWRLFPGEYVEGEDGKRINGLVIARIQEFEIEGRAIIRVQVGEKFVEVEASDFPSAVRRYEDDAHDF